MHLDGAVAIVTGGNGGLGRRIGRALALQGVHVVVTYARSQADAEGVAAELSAIGPRAIAVRADQTQPDQIDALVERVLAEFGRVDVLVNNAAYNQWVPYRDLDKLTLELWDRILTTNLTGPFMLCKAVAGPMRRQGRGRIVNIASVAGLAPTGSSIAYAVSKAALIHLTRCLAVALAPDVLVNAVAPGLMDGTRMTANLAPEYVERARQGAVLGRAAERDDVADLVVTLVRSESITGQTIPVDAGRVFH
ncbi:MAG TPA: SDR family NAD(P)-dependent oxidoreductase [Chloroflexota bacterium]